MFELQTVLYGVEKGRGEARGMVANNKQRSGGFGQNKVCRYELNRNRERARYSFVQTFRPCSFLLWPP